MRSKQGFAAAGALLLATTLGLAQRFGGAELCVHSAADLVPAAITGSDGVAAKLPPSGLRTVWHSQDNVRGVELVLAESDTHYYFRFQPFEPPPRYRAHLTNPTVTDYGYVEHDDGSTVERYEMAGSGGTIWTKMPKPATPLAGDGRYRIGAWAACADHSDLDQSFFRIDADIVQH